MIRRKTSMDYSHISPDMTPMIDMVFILLIFVLVAASFVKISDINVNLPSGSHNEVVAKDPLVVEITANGDLKLANKMQSLNEVIAQLSLIKDRQILIAADKLSQTQYLIQFLDKCNEAEINNIKVAVQRGA
ncbi:biopolymer transporter ExbD [Thiomicrorhabdus hydrogeniphila]